MTGVHGVAESGGVGSGEGKGNGHGASATPESHYGTKSVAAAMTVSLTPALSQRGRGRCGARCARLLLTSEHPGMNAGRQRPETYLAVDASEY